MALTDEGTNTTMLVSPTGIGGNGGFGFGDGNGWWILLLFILMGGWGNGFGGGFGDGGIYPWMNQSNQISSGFQNQMLNDSITGITNGISGISNQLCNGFAGITNTMNQNTMADMERSFSVQSALQNCCCENRASVADLKYTVATEACADRAAIGDALQAVIASNTANTQKILDKMCQAEIDSLKGQVLALQNQNNMLNLAASQTAQTAQLIADNTAQTQYIVNRVAPYPIPAYTVANPTTPAA